MNDRLDANVNDRLDGLGTMGRRDYLRATGVAALGTAGLAGCVGRATGTLATSVTDQPADIGDFESLLVTIEGVWLGPEGGNGEGGDGETDEDGSDAENGTETDEGDDDGTDGDGDEPEGREYHEFDESQEADLVQLQGDETQLIDERELETGTYPYLQLDVSGTDATLTDGGDATVDLPGNAPLTFNREFEIREDSVTSFTADFAPVGRGDGTYLLRPVPRGIEVSYDDEGE